MHKKVRLIAFGILKLQEWRLIPWYTSETCKNGCCVFREFTWLFLGVRASTIRRDSYDMDI